MLARLFVFKAVFCGLLFEGDMSRSGMMSDTPDRMYIQYALIDRKTMYVLHILSRESHAIFTWQRWLNGEAGERGSPRIHICLAGNAQQSPSRECKCENGKKTEKQRPCWYARGTSARPIGNV